MMPGEPSPGNFGRPRDEVGYPEPEAGGTGALEFGTPRSSTDGKVLLGVCGGFLLGLFTGWMAPTNWLDYVRIPPKKGGVQESIAGGVGMTFTPLPQSTVTTVGKADVPKTIKTFQVYFDTNNSQLGSSQQKLVLGDYTGSPLNVAEIKDQRFAYVGEMTYEIYGSTVDRTFSLVDQDSTFTKTFTGGIPTPNDTSDFSCKEVPTTDGKSQLELRYMGYLDIIDMELVAST